MVSCNVRVSKFLAIVFEVFLRIYFGDRTTHLHRVLSHLAETRLFARLLLVQIFDSGKQRRLLGVVCD